MDADGPARVKALTKFGADFYLPTKLTHAAGCLMGGLSSRARSMRSLEGVATLVDETLVTAETAEKIREIEVVTEQGFTEKITTQFMEAESSIAKSSVIQPRPLSVLVDEVRKLGGVIPLHCKKLAKEVKSALKILQEKLKNLKLEQLKKTYGQKTVNNVLIKAELEHIYNFELSLKRSRDAGGFILNIQGGHFPGVCEALEKTGLIKIIKKEQLFTGAIDYTLRDTLSGNKFYKTEFPSHWTEEKLGKAIWEIYEFGKDDISDKVHYKKGSVDDFGIKLVLKYIDNSKNKNPSFYKIETALPYLEKKK